MIITFNRSKDEKKFLLQIMIAICKGISKIKPDTPSKIWSCPVKWKPPDKYRIIFLLICNVLENVSETGTDTSNRLIKLIHEIIRVVI